jgi:hypothetical protein
VARLIWVSTLLLLCICAWSRGTESQPQVTQMPRVQGTGIRTQDHQSQGQPQVPSTGTARLRKIHLAWFASLIKDMSSHDLDGTLKTIATKLF